MECKYCQVSVKHMGKELKLIFKFIWISRIDKLNAFERKIMAVKRRQTVNNYRK